MRRNKLLFNSIIAGAAALCLAITVACDVGLGKEVDIEAPVLSVLKMVCKDNDQNDVARYSFDTTKYTKKKVTFSGVASDNSGEVTVHSEIKWLGESDYSFFKDVSWTSEGWELPIEFEKEGACWLKIIAEDKVGNYSPKSAKVISLFVDEQGPVGDAWYIDRLVNGIQYNLSSLDGLKTIVAEDENLEEPANIDTAQNDEFLICGTFTDATGIADGMTLDLYDENGVKQFSGIPVDTSVSSSNYAPKFRINGTELGLPESGKHYYQICYNAKDLVTDPAPNETKDEIIEMGWFLWWPQGDNPRCSISNVDKGFLNVHTGDSINITVFDDDALAGKIIYSLTGKYDNKNGEEEISGTTTREINITIKAPSKPQEMTLTVAAKDINNKPLNKTVKVTVSDDYVPTLIITSPENNQIPEVSGVNADITFSGITLDKTGCKYVEFVWVPDSVKESVAAKKSLAEAWLSEIAAINGKHDDFVPAGDNKVKATAGTGDYAGCVLWSAKLTSEGQESTFLKHSINFTLSLFNDFGTEQNKDKYFLIRVTREDGNYTETELKLAADNIAPEIVPVNPGGNMAIIDQDNDLIIKFKATKTNGVEMNTSKYKLINIASDGSETEIGGSYDSTEGVFKANKISSSTLAAYAASNINPKYRMEAEDKLGNGANAVYQFIISALPQIKSVTSSASSKCKLDDEILINVAFSKPVTCNKETTLKLKGILNTSKGIAATDVVSAAYSSGSGSTTLVFKYKVAEGDICTSGLEVYNEPSKGPVSGMDSSSVHLETLLDENNLQAKRSTNPICIDGITPKVSAVTVVCEDKEADNTVAGKTYLKAGRTIKATVRTDKKVTVQGSPKFVLKKDGGTLYLNFQSISADGTTLTFTKKVSSSDSNGEYKYSNDSYLTDFTVLKDEYGNKLTVDSDSEETSVNLVIDTNKPAVPVITKITTDAETGAVTKSELKSGKYSNEVTFTITENDNEKTQYSLDGGSNWIDYKTEGAEKLKVTVNDNASLVARIVDYAGNVSDYTKVIALEINSTFPDFTVECSNSDGNYKYKEAGTKLEFKVSFVNDVTIPKNSSAYIQLSDANTGDSLGEDGRATLVDNSAETTGSIALFSYTVQKGDNFALKIAKGDVHLDGVYDTYKIYQNGKKLKDDYVRNKLIVDTVSPVITAMTPKNSAESEVTTYSQNELNAYKDVNQIQLTFNENVKAVSGKIILRQTEGWAIPAMFTADEFNTVLGAVKSADIDKDKTNNLTGTQVLYMDGLEDAENLYGSLCGAANDRYHGTAQYVGPYKKMTNGVDSDGNPDLSVKYVLDFGVDIWNSSNSTKDKFGRTFEPNWTKDGENKTYLLYHHLSQTGCVHVVTPENTIKTDSIRYVLEQAGYHQRSVEVNSTYISVNDNVVTITLPEDLFGNENLPVGRQWELLIAKGAFMDETGNYFGAGEDGSVATTEFALIPNGTNNSFMSYGVEKPVIRVDRYSYGLGIKQPKVENGVITEYEQIDVKSVGSTDCQNGNGTTAPSAYVGVRIDCGTPGAKVRYSKNKVEKTSTDATGSRTDGGATTKYSTTAQALPAAPSGDGSDNVIFPCGTGDYTKSCKEYIVADALYNGTSIKSETASEGVFQTVLNINQPKHNGANNTIYNAGDGRQDVSIHGTTGLSGEPTIAPFPLRDQPVGSAYMRRTYQKVDQYYWVSYEVLVDAGVSMYVFGQWAYTGYDNYGVTNFRRGWNDWAKTYGLISVGEYNTIGNLESWPAKCTAKDSDIVPDKNQ